MLTTTLLITLAVIVACGAMVQTLTGFGMNLVAVTLGALLLPIEVWLPVVVAINLPLTGWIAWRDRAHVQWGLLLRRILPLMMMGGAIGFSLALWMDGGLLKRVLGIVVVAVTLRELAMLAALIRLQTARMPEPWMLLAGVAQGMYATGGPFLAYAVGGLPLSRLAYRATLMVVWLTMNTLLTIAFVLNGRATDDTAVQATWMLPGLVLGMLLGEALYARVPERGFKVCVQLTLLVAGVALVLV